ncbi:pyridoxal phosphate-dependent transferase [Kockovaella imperatae]|uniref:Pyridoxal phosphate-dependent transferase n=1 Tax=Kockovaella imperatae TaxID=4999 RepID=A0A1Y1UR39_9TREE|nr:pyridoxal phosphate-dependent transferase [Kockovaella imperatae]ORX39954.1 pyridoxal phosphate-dependent transferase [Kockovaella imperatae]
MSSGESSSSRIDYSRLLSWEAKHRARSGIKMLRPYMSIPGMISFGGGYPHASTWPVNGMTLSLPFSGESVFVPGYQTNSPDGLLPLASYSPPPKTSTLQPHLAAELQYSQTFGQVHFISWLKEHIARIHNPPYAKYEDYTILNTAGNTDGVDAVLRTCMDKGDHVLVEEFAYPGTLSHCESLGLPAIGVPMDSDGIVPSALEDMMSRWDENERGGKRPKFLLVVPTCSNPAGATIPAERKREIYTICRKWGLMIIEDDPYYFLQIRPNGVDSPPCTSFLSMDIDGRVIRLDSFSKIVAPGSRCGFITGPTELVTHIMYSRECSTQLPSGFSIAIISSILQAWGGHEGYEKNYLPYISSVYSKRAILMSNLISKHVPAKAATAPPPSGGMFLWLRLHLEDHPDISDTSVSLEDLAERVFQSLIEAKVLTVPSKFFKAPGKSWTRDEEAKRIFLRLSFATATEEEITEGVQRIGRALTKEWRI